MYPCIFQYPETPGLYTYYAIVSLVVVILVISLIWIPVVQSISEFNNIIAKLVIYIDRELFGSSNTCFLNNVEAFFSSQQALIIVSVCFLIYSLYLASSDFLVFAGCYIYNLPDNQYMYKLKRKILEVIIYLLNLTGKKNLIPLTRRLKGRPYKKLKHSSDIPLTSESFEEELGRSLKRT